MDGSGPSFSGKVYSIINMVMTLMSLWLSYSYHNFRFFTGCCCFIPCVMDGFHDYEHMCPQCNAIIGKSTPDDREEERKKGLKTFPKKFEDDFIFFIFRLEAMCTLLQ